MCTAPVNTQHHLYGHCMQASAGPWAESMTLASFGLDALLRHAGKHHRWHLWPDFVGRPGAAQAVLCIDPYGGTLIWAPKLVEPLVGSLSWAVLL